MFLYLGKHFLIAENNLLFSRLCCSQHLFNLKAKAFVAKCSCMEQSVQSRCLKGSAEVRQLTR